MSKYKPKYSRIAQLKTAADFSSYLKNADIPLQFSPELVPGFSEVFNQEILLKSGKKIGNRFCILPMEGWDGTVDGRPTEHTKNRWKKFAISGAKLLFGCEAVAVVPEGRANTRQLMLNAETYPEIKKLKEYVFEEHQNRFGNTDDLYVGLQLTHSGRFCKPYDDKRFESKVLYSHPVLDQKFSVNLDHALLSDEDIDIIIEKYIDAAVLAQQAGFHFVDVKHCHGYLGHEFLSAVDRPGKYGGSLENRTLYMRSIIAGIRKKAPGLDIAVRLSVADLRAYKKTENGEGQAVDQASFAFGADQEALDFDLSETFEVLKILQNLGVELICVTLGSPYYNPHLTRPALFPPSDGYHPPEDPLEGVQRHIAITKTLKEKFPDLIFIGSGYSYLQEWLPHVAHYNLSHGWVDSVGIGRLVLSYPEFPADACQEKSLQRNLLCRTFSDCTTAPRNGLISGCYPLDPYYKSMPEAEKVKELKAEI
jgi:NADPH2 dehydrogenase